MEKENAYGYFTKSSAELRAADYYMSLRTDSNTWKSIDSLQPQLLEFEHLIRGHHFERAVLLLNELDENYLSMWNYNERVVQMRSQLAGKVYDKKLESLNLGLLGKSYYDLGNFEKALEFCELAINVTDGTLNEMMPQWWMTIGRVYLNKGKYEIALENYRKAIDASRSLGNEHDEGQAIGLMGLPNYLMGNYEKAIEYYSEALKLIRKSKDKLWEAIYEGNIGLALSDYGQYNEAIKYHKTSLALAKEIGNKRWEAIVLGDFGKTYRRLGKYNDAIVAHKTGVIISQSLGLKPNECRCLTELGRDYISIQDFKQAVYCLKDALEIAQKIGNPVDINASLTSLATAQLFLQDIKNALLNIERIDTSSNFELFYSQLIYGVILFMVDDAVKSKSALKESIKLADDLIAQTPQLAIPIYSKSIAFFVLALLSHGQEKAVFYQNYESALSSAKQSSESEGIVYEVAQIMDIIKSKKD